MKIEIKRLNNDSVVPSYATKGDAGADLHASHSVVILPGESKLVPTGISLAIPEGYVGLVHPRSGLAAKHGITVLNAPGTIDSGFRGELKVILINHGTDSYSVSRNDRIAQLVIQKVEEAEFVMVDELSSSERGLDGFGSTGV